MREFYKIFIFISLVFNGVLFAQTEYKSQDDLKKNAEKLFEEDEFSKALPLYSQLLSLYPKEADYNFKFGVCLLSAGNDKEKPLTYLEFAAKKPEVNKDVFFYLGRAYHLNYRFADAITAYTKFKSSANPKSLKKLDVDRQIEMCNNGSKLLKNITDLVVLQKKELKVEEAFRAYDLSNIGGKLLVMPDEFKSPLDKKKKNESIIFLSQRTDELYFASYGKEEKNGKDIYKVRKLPNGEWSAPLSLGSPINTPYDEDYPYLHPDGKTFYFCSKGHNSMGGYDVFKSTLNDNGTWGAPVNVDFAISTPDDDYLYVADSSNTFAYFSSKRSSGDGFTTIYKLKVDRVPIEIALIKGNYSSEVNSASKSAKITVKNVDNGELIGVFSTNNNGDYLINLPNGGKFLFTIEPEEGKSQTELVALPIQYELNPLRQQITQKSDRIEVANFFDEIMVDQNSYMAALDFIKQRANLEVNSTEEAEKAKAEKAEAKKEEQTVANVNSETNSANPSQDKKVNTFSNKELVDIAYKDAEDAKKEAAELKENSDYAFGISNERNEQAIAKSKEAEEIATSAESISDPSKKQEELDKANQLRQESKILAKEAVAAYNLGQSLENESVSKQTEADQGSAYAKDLDNAIKSDSKESIAKLTKQKEELERNEESEKNALTAMKSQADSKKAEAEKANKKSAELEKDINDIKAEQSNLKEEAAKAKDKTLKDALDLQVTELDEELEAKKKDQKVWSEKAVALSKESEDLNSDVTIADNLLNQIKSSSGSQPVAAVDKQKLGASIAGYQANDNTVNGSTNTQSTNENSVAVKKATEENSVNSSEENKQNNISSNSGNENSQNSNTIGSNTISIVNPTTASSSEETKTSSSSGADVAEMNFSYEAEIKNLDGITEEGRREAAKAKVYKDWSIALNQEATKRKTELPSISDAQKQQEEKEMIALLEFKAKEKERLAGGTTSGSAETQNNIASNSTVSSGSNNVSSSNGVNVINSVQGDLVSSEYKESSSKFQSEFQKTDDIKDPAEKEQAKSKLLDEWSVSMSKEIAALKDKSNTTSDDSEKARLNDAITKLEAEKAEKETEASQSFAKAARLRKEQQSTQGSASVESSDNKKYEDEILSAKNNPSETERESLKANTYKQWAESIDKEIETIKNSKTGTSEQLSDDDVLKISALEASSKEKKQLADASLARVEELKKNTEVVVTNSSNSSENTTLNSDNSSSTDSKKQSNVTETLTASTQKRQAADIVFEKNVVELESIQNPIEKEERRTMVYDDWARDIRAEIALLNETKTSASDEEKAQLDLRIKELETQLLDKQALASSSLAKASRLKREQSSTAASSTETNKQSSDSENKASNSEVIANSNIENKSENVESYTASVALSETALDAKKRIEASEMLYTKADSLRKLAYSNNDNTQRAALLDEANEIELQARKQKVNAYENFVNANNSQYNSNKAILKELAEASAKSTSDDATIGAMLVDEAESFNSDSKNIQATIGASENATLMESSLQRASASQIRALEKQEKAIASYKKANPNYVVTGKYKAEASESLVVNSSSLTDNSVNEVKKSANDQKELASVATENNSNETAINSSNNSQRINGTDNSSSDNSSVQQTSNSTEIVSNESGQVNSNKNTADGLAVNKVVESVEYKQLQQESERLKNNSAQENSVAESFKMQSNEQRDAAFALRTSADTISDSNVKNDYLRQASEKDALSKLYSYRADSVLSLAQNSDAAAKAKKAEADLLAQPETENKSTVVATKVPSEQEKSTNMIASNETTSNASYLTETNELKQEVFEAFAADKTKYSKSNPIPINEKLPSGLVFKVQVGAFKNPVSPDQFKGFAPLMGETTSFGVTRYTAGMFKSFESANSAKGKIRDLGFKDAFVVAFCNGSRIPTNEALAMIKEGRSCPSSTMLASNEGSKIEKANESSVVNSTNTERIREENLVVNSNNTERIKEESPVVNSNVNSPSTNSVTSLASSEPVKAVEVEKVKGLFYTVQVGVYSGKVEKSKLENLDPVYSEQTATGATRYSSGIFNNINDAAAARNKIIALGVKDAFVTVYHNGKRISMEESRRLIAQQGNEILATSSEMNKVPTSTITEKPAETQTTENKVVVSEKPLVAVSKAVSDTGIVFKVQIGAFKEEVPVEIAAMYLKIAQKGINHYLTEDGLTIYTVGAVSDYQLANQLKEEVIQQGLKDAFVVAYKKGEKVSLDEVLNK